MHNFDNLTSELKRYQEAKKAYFAHTVTDDASALRHVELRRAYDDAAHSVAFHADIAVDSIERAALEQPPVAYALMPEDGHDAAALQAARERLEAYPPSHSGFTRVLESIEQHD